MTKQRIGVIGLGYVGLPLAHAFSFKNNVVGYDVNQSRVEELKNGVDCTRELSVKDIQKALDNGLNFTSMVEDLSVCNVFIITVPTPVNNSNVPDLNPLKKASILVASYLKKKDVVIYESTVFPGATEEICVPLLEEGSGLTFNKDFFCGYSPERINPGDKERTLTNIMKVTSGSNHETAIFVDALYAEIIQAGTHLAPNIKVAEAAKVIENSQRDINIAFINELAIIFDKLGIKTKDVLDAAGTKWNFLNFQPGLVGGHCIGVDPFYLTYKAQQVGYKPEVILSGRKINDFMASYVANRIFKLLIKKYGALKNKSILILGMTFKENCPDIRNTKVVDVFNELIELGCNVDISDPIASKYEVKSAYQIDLKVDPNLSDYSLIFLAVPHKEYLNLKFPRDTIIFDLKSVLQNSTDSL